jgi:TPP-dependent indolepyruvate ferredoxin oxidoreductase alpha subunit
LGIPLLPTPGITGLLDAVNDKSPVTVIIADNSTTTGMTGGQKSSATGKVEDICRGVGVEEAAHQGAQAAAAKTTRRT